MLLLYLWKGSMWCHRRGFRIGHRFLRTLMFLGWGALLDPDAEIEGFVNFAHRGLGVGIHGNVRLGDWVQIWQHAMITSNNDKGSEHGVYVGRGAEIGAYAIILGPAGRSLTIGENARVGAGAIVVEDVPPGGIVVPEASRVFTDEQWRELRAARSNRSAA
jgi:serine O-acetyltransferase